MTNPSFDPTSRVARVLWEHLLLPTVPVRCGCGQWDSARSLQSWNEHVAVVVTQKLGLVNSPEPPASTVEELREQLTRLIKEDFGAMVLRETGKTVEQHGGNAAAEVALVCAQVTRRLGNNA